MQLENIRSHVKSTIPFTHGFNCLVGALGCGKSSILYSIDFALFGDPLGRSFDYLLREGTEHGKITVQFSHNAQSYKIVRGIRRRAKGIGQDLDDLKLFQSDSLLASMKSEAVAEQLRSITGIDKDLWREIIWVRQEHLKELLDASPRDRQKRLDELFGLADYENAWNEIAGYQRDYESEKRLLEKDSDVVSMEKLAVEYNRVTEEYALLEVSLQGAQEAIVKARKCLEEADAKLRKLEEKKSAVEELRREEARLLANISNTENVEKSLNESASDKRAILESLNQRRISIEDQILSSKDRLKTVGIYIGQSGEVSSDVLHDFDDRVGNLKAEQETTLRATQLDQKRVTQLSTNAENQCPLCLQPLNDEYRAALLHRIQQETSERQEQMARLQGEITGLLQTRRVAVEAISNLQMLPSRMEDVKARVNEEEKNLSRFLREVDEKKNLCMKLQRQLESVRFEINRFDVSDLEVAREQSKRALRECLVAEAEINAKQNRKQDLLERMDEVKERIDLAQKKLERIQTLAKTTEMIGAIRDAYRGIQPKLRSEFVKILRNFVQQVLDGLIGEGQMLNVVVDDTYSPFIKSEGGVEREVSNLSGGERTLLAFAYRLGLGQLIMQSRTGHGLSLLLLDEPTESLGREDGSIDRLAEAISRFRAIEQIVAVTHSEAFAEKAEHVITLEKEAGESRVSIAAPK